MIKQPKLIGTQSYSIQKYNQGKSSNVEDSVAMEAPLLIKLKTPDQEVEDLVITMQTPTDTEALVMGFLYTEGTIDSLEHVKAIDITGSEALVTLTQAPIKKAERNTVSTAACGMCGKTSLDAIKLVRVFDLHTNDIRIKPEALLGMNTQLREKQVLFESTGGIHAAALFDKDGHLLVLKEDIGRHNAVDKVIGSMLMQSINPSELCLFVSGRAGFELVQKCLVSGIPLMVAVGAPSSLAVDYAKEHGMTLIGFMQRERFNIYSHSERVGAKKAENEPKNS